MPPERCDDAKDTEVTRLLESMRETLILTGPRRR